MNIDYYLLPHPGIQSLEPYIPGKSIEELAREQGITDIIKLASNENPLGCSPYVKEVLANLDSLQIASYPSPLNHPLMQKIKDKLAIDERMIILGDGTDLLFFFLLVSFALHTDKHVLTHDCAFLSYQVQAQTLGIPVVKTGLNENWQVDIDAMIHACNEKTALIFLANPNNPTGAFIPQDDIKRLLASIPPTTILVIDEAYYEYAYEREERASLDLLGDYPNLVVTRTFSKAYGLAGLRLGFAIACQEIIDLLRRVQPPFAVNQVALAAADAALDDENFIQWTREQNAKGMHQMQEGLRALQFAFHPSHCNFVTIDCQTDAKPVYQKLLSYGIIVRPLNQYGLPRHLRVTIGKSEQIARFLDKLALCLRR